MSPEREPRRVALGLGSNLGDRVAALRTAVEVLCADPQVEFVAVSAVYETDPVGGPSQPDYLNAVLVVDTSLAPLEVLALSRIAESELDRTREVRWGARTLDVDVLGYGDVVSDDPVLTLPHPRAAERAFVLIPWADADPGYVLPGLSATVAQLADRLPAADRVAVRPTAHEVRG